MAEEKLVWLVDGEPQLRDLIPRILEGRPYKITEIANPDEASERLKSGEVPNVISYMTITGAKAFYRENQKFLEETPLLIATGLPGDLDVEGMNGVCVIEKPFNLTKYVRAIDYLAGEKTVQVGSVTTDVTWGVQMSRQLQKDFFTSSFFADYNALNAGLQIMGTPSALIIDFDKCSDIERYTLDERLKETPIVFVAENYYKALDEGCLNAVGKDPFNVSNAVEKAIYH